MVSVFSETVLAKTRQTSTMSSIILARAPAAIARLRRRHPRTALPHIAESLEKNSQQDCEDVEDVIKYSIHQRG